MRVPNANAKLFNGGLVCTTEKPALSLGLEDGQSVYVELTDEQVLSIVEQGLYYLGRRARVIFARERLDAA